MSIFIKSISQSSELIPSIQKRSILTSEGRKNITSEDDVVICLQREYTLVNKNIEAKSQTSSFIGTKNLQACIFVYLYNDQNHLAIHCDTHKGLDFSSLVRDFSNKDNLKVMLIGGNGSSASSL